MKANEIRNKTIEELGKLISELRVRIEKTGLEQRAKKLKDTNAVKELKIELARLLTVKKEKELEK